MNQLLLDRKQAAKALGVSVVYVDVLTRRGVLRCTKLGKRVMYCPADLEQFVRERREATQRD